MSNGHEFIQRRNRPLFLNRNEGENLALVLSMLPRQLATELERWVLVKGKENCAPSTLRALLANWADFARWAKESGRLPFITMANPEDLSSYFDDHAYLARATLDQRHSQLMKLFKVLDHPQTPALRDTLREHFKCIRGEKRYAASRGQPLALHWNDIERILEALDPDKSIRDERACLALRLAYDTMLRSSELANLRAQDFRREVLETQSLQGIGGYLHITRGSKDKSSHFDVLVCSEPAAQVVEKWINALGLAPKDHLICRLNEMGNLSISNNRPVPNKEISQIFKQAATKAGFSGEAVAKISGFSPRIGMVKDLLKDGRGVEEVMHLARWKSPSMVLSHARDIHISQYATRIMGYR